MTSIDLGGNIRLNGFKEVDPASMVILKKMIGNYCRKMSDISPTFQGLEVSLKLIHGTEEGHAKYEIHAKAVDNGQPRNAEIVDRNLFVAIDSSLRKVWHTFSK